MGWSAFRKNGLTHHNLNLSIKGYTIFCANDSKDVILLDMQGRIAKLWHFDDFWGGLVKLHPNGNLLIAGVTTEARTKANALAKDDYSDPDLRCLRIGGGMNTLREYGWGGNLIWSYDNLRMHHDFHLCDNGDFLFPEWVVLPEEVAQKVEGGYRKAEPKPYMYGDDIVRINRQGEEADRWHTWQMLDPVEDPIGPLQGRMEWTHMNSVNMMPDGQIIASLCENSRVIMIDPEKREITWQIGDPEISMQHHATPVPGGNIQIFDNGRKRPLSIPYSQIIEVDPRTSDPNKGIVWRYKPANSEQFFSGHISSAQRLARGNVLICEGANGRLFEITRAGEIVWEWLSPFVTGNDDGTRLFQWIYRAYRYPYNHPAFAGKAIDYKNCHNINSVHELI